MTEPVDLAQASADLVVGMYELLGIRVERDGHRVIVTVTPPPDATYVVNQTATSPLVLQYELDRARR